MKSIYKNIKFSLSTKSFTPKMPILKTVKSKQNPKIKKNSNIYNLLVSEKLVGKTNDIQNFYDNTLVYTKSKKNSKIMLDIFTSNNTTEEATMTKFYAFINQNLNANELEKFFIIIIDLQKTLKDEEIEKTENIFKIFIDKINTVSTNKSKYFLIIALCDMLLNHLSIINIKDIDLSKINRGSVSQMEIVTDMIQSESAMRNSIKIFKPIYNDLDNPANDLKDV